MKLSQCLQSLSRSLHQSLRSLHQSLRRLRKLCRKGPPSRIQEQTQAAQDRAGGSRATGS